MSLEITPRLVDEIVAYFDQADDAARLWKGLCFMERHGIDLALRSAELIGYLRDHPNSPVPEARSLSGDELRELVLAIRERARQVTGLPPLAKAERDAWRLERRPPRPSVVRKGQSKKFGENRRRGHRAGSGALSIFRMALGRSSGPPPEGDGPALDTRHKGPLLPARWRTQANAAPCGQRTFDSNRLIMV